MKETMIVTVFSLFPAPAGAPLNVSVIAVPPDSLSVSWEPPDCLLWNSPLITSYTIHLLSLSLSQPSEAEETVEEGLEYELTGLASFIEYSVSVSASNGQGRGPLSQPVAATLITGRTDYSIELTACFMYWVACTTIHTYIHTYSPRSTAVSEL